MAAEYLQTQPPALPANVRRVLETGLPTKFLMDWELGQRNWYENTVVSLDSRLTTVKSQTDNNTAAITQEVTARTDADSALAQRITTTEASVGTVSARVEEVAFAGVQGDQALAARIDSIEVDSGGGFASGRVQFYAVAAPSGYQAAYDVQVKASDGANFASAGMTLLVDGNGASSIALNAGQLTMTDPSYNGGLPGNVFGYASGRFQFNVPVRVQTQDIGFQQVSTPYTAAPSGLGSFGPDNAWHDICAVGIAGAAGAYALVNYVVATGRNFRGSGNFSFGTFRLWSDTLGDLSGEVTPNVIQTDGAGRGYTGYGYSDSVGYPQTAGFRIMTEVPTTDVIRLQFKNQNGAGQGDIYFVSQRSGLAVLVIKR